MNAFLFPGQGSQNVGMGSFLYDNFQTAKLTFEEASDALNIDLKKLCFTSTSEELALTENTQPALLTVSTATSRVLTHDIGLKAHITAGHSIGEYSSLVLGDVLSFSEALRAVRVRGLAMQSAVPIGQGGMTAALGLNEEQVFFLCRWAVENSGYSPLSPANFNCEGQIVLSGNSKTLDWLKLNYKPEIIPGDPKRSKLIPLQVSAPFHCEMMKPAQIKMEKFFENITFNNSKIKIIQNVHAQVETQGELLKKNIINQVSAPVRWSQSMLKLKEQGISNCFEVGNGNVLKGLLKKIDSDFFKVYSTTNLDDIKAIENLNKE